MRVIRTSHVGRLLATVLTVALLFSGVSSRSDAAGNDNSTYDYLCCTSQLLSHLYHPGDAIVIHWKRTLMASEPKGTLTITAAIIGPFKSDNALQHYEGRPRGKSDLTWAVAPRLVIANSVPLNPVSVIHISKFAKSGFYDLEMKTVWNASGNTAFGASIFRVVR